jgi:hypothetical protein
MDKFYVGPLNLYVIRYLQFFHAEYVNFWDVIWKLQKNVEIFYLCLFHHMLFSRIEISSKMLYGWSVHKFYIVFHNIFGILKYVSF